MPWPPTGWRAPSPSWWRPPGSSSRSSLPIQSSYRSWRDLRAFLWTMCLEREQFTGPVNAARYAGERGYHIGRTAAERAGLPPDVAHAQGKRAYFAAYFTDLAEEATVRAQSWRDAMRRHGDAGADA